MFPPALRPYSLLALLGLSALLTACGGGGGGGGNPPTNPEPPAPATYSVGGQVHGLNGSGLVLRLNDGNDLAIDADSSFSFGTALLTATPYKVTVASNPVGQICEVQLRESGVIGSTNITDVRIECGAALTVSGTISGQTAPGLVLRLNGGADLAIDSGATFTFPTPLRAGGSYAVTVLANATGQICTVSSGGSGTIDAAVTDVAIACTTPPPAGGNNYTIGGTITGLTENGLVLSNLGDEIAVPANTTQFTFPVALQSGTSYSVSIVAQPPNLVCSLPNANGAVAHVAVTTLSVSCAPRSLQAGLSVDHTSLTFIAEQGAPLATQTVVGSIQDATQPVHVSVQNAGVIPYAYYTSLSATSGQIVVTTGRTYRAPGTYTGSITITACYDVNCQQPLSGSPLTIPVTLTIQPPAPPATLLVSEHGIAFASVPAHANLNRTLTVSDSSGATTTWTAASNQSWLSATASGNSNGSLVLTANPNALADGFYEASVVVTSSNSALAPQTIHAGLYVSSSASASAFATTPVLHRLSYPVPAANTAVDNIRPLFYSASGPDIAVDHVYTGARVATITTPGADYGNIAVNDDGTRLFAFDNSTTPNKIAVFDLGTRQLIDSFTFPQFDAMQQFSHFRILHARVHGRSALLFNSVQIQNATVAPIVDAETGQQLGDLGTSVMPGYDFMIVSHNGKVAYSAWAGLSGVLDVSRSDIHANSQGNVYGIHAGTTPSYGVSALQDLATNSDGSRLYAGWFTQGFVHTYTFANGAFTETAPIWFVHPPNSGNPQLNGGNLEIDAMDYRVVGMGDGQFKYYGPDETLLIDTTLPDPSPVSAIGYGSGDHVRISSDGLRLLGGNGSLLDLR